MTTSRDEAKYHQLIEQGFCVFEGVVDPEMLDQLRNITGRLLVGQSEEARARQRTTGSMLPVVSDPFFSELIAWPRSLAALASLGFTQPTFSDGWIISKPPHSPRLFWHYDWFAWEDSRSYEPVPMQLFLMYYLSDTRPQNGCLRVISGSHRHHNPLHDLIAAPHSKALAQGENMDAPEFSDRPDEVNIAVKAGDLVVGDARLLHAAHANETDEHRTLITLWYQPDLKSLPERMQAQMAKKVQQPPETWPRKAQVLVSPLLARYEGTAEPYERTLYRRKPEGV